MTRDEMIKRIAAVIRECRYVNRSSEDIAAAVLDLCGPKPLVWEGVSPLIFAKVSMGEYVVQDEENDGWGLYTPHELDDDPPHSRHANKATAQAAAQDHADAAHWARTPLGDL